MLCTRVAMGNPFQQAANHQKRPNNPHPSPLRDSTQLTHHKRKQSPGGATNRFPVHCGACPLYPQPHPAQSYRILVPAGSTRTGSIICFHSVLVMLYNHNVNRGKLIEQQIGEVCIRVRHTREELA